MMKVPESVDRMKREKTENVMKRVYDMRRLSLAWQQVRDNAGAAGIDKMTVEAFSEREQELLLLIHETLKAGDYRFKPAKRVLIPKPGTSKMRKLGIPTVMDRVVSQSINSVFEEIFDSDFTPSNFGFRRGKSQHRAIGHARQAVIDGHEWCASIDLQSFFDEIPHDLILKLIRRKIRDEQLVTLIARALKAGVMVDGIFEKTTKGCPQGSPLSPRISNIVLNELDHEIEKRGLRYCRWADDFLIFTKSERAAKRILESISRYLEVDLKLPVNREKSEAARVKSVEFLGFGIHCGKIRVSMTARTKFKNKVRELTKRNNPLSMYEIIQQLNKYLGGWISYYRVQEFRELFGDLDGWIRSRLRSTQLKKWKNPRKFQRMLILAGFFPDKARKVWVRMRHWQSVMRPEVRFALSNKWFRQKRLIFLEDYLPRNLEFKLNR